MADGKNNKDNKVIEVDFSRELEANSLNNQSYYFSTSSSYNTGNLTYERIKEYVKYPMIYNAILKEISKIAYNSQGIYSNTIDYMVSIPLLQEILSMRKNTKQNKAKKKRMNNVIKLLDLEKTTRDGLRKILVEGMYVGILRDTTATNKNPNTGSASVGSLDRIEGLSLDDNFMIQPLDLDYCKVIGFQNNIQIAAFDMQYFDQYKYGGLVNEIKNYPKDFMKGYLSYKKDANKRWYVLDYRKTVVVSFKSNLEEPYGRPLGLSAFAEMKASEDYDDSQYNLISELASSIYYMVLPEGERAGSCSLNKTQQENQINAFRNAVKINTSSNTSKISTLTLAPKTQVDRLTKDASLLKDTLSDENMKKISTSLGFASSALNAASEGGASYSSLQVNIDLVGSQVFQYVNRFAVEYTRVVNEWMKQKPFEYIDIKYLPISWLNQEEFYKKAEKLYMTAGGSRKVMIASIGMNPEDYLSILDEEIEDRLDEKYPPHITSYTSSDSADKSNPDGNQGNRPEKSERDLTPSGQVTRNLGSNEQRKPSS